MSTRGEELRKAEGDGVEDHSSFMRRALELAERGWGRTSPNPLVGAVVVRNGEVVGEGWHAEFGGDHAEAMALGAAGELARGATIYVTLEPCSHHGKTPPCTRAIRDAGIARLVYACDDPNPAATGGGEQLADEGVEVISGVEESTAHALNAPFFHRHSRAGESRPWIELKLALTLDARIADHAGRSVWITGDEARAEVHRLRAGHDAVAVGIGTVLADDPLLTVRDAPAPRRVPTRIVFDRRLRLPRDSRLLASVDQAPLLVVHGSEASEDAASRLRDAGAQLHQADDLASALQKVRDAGIGSIFCEGGGQIAGALLRDGVVDRLTLFYAPLMLGPGARSPFADLPDTAIAQAGRWRTIRRAAFGEDTLISFER